MKTIFLIATDSIRALLHQRLLLGLMLASLALTIFFSIIMSKERTQITESFSDDRMTNNSVMGTNKMSAADRRKFQETMENASTTFQAMFYQVASFGGSIVALFIFSTAVASEIRKGTIRLTLSKPVSRTQFLLGKYLGGVVVMAAFALLTSLAILIFAQTQNLELSPVIKWAPWLMFCRQLMLGSLAMLLSLFMHPIIAAVLAFVAGNGFYSLDIMGYCKNGAVGTSPAFAVLRYDDTKLVGLKDAKFDAAYSAVGKLKPIPEAMWFWVEALRLRGVKS